MPTDRRRDREKSKICIGKLPRTQTKDGRWRRKKSEAGKKRRPR